MCMEGLSSCPELRLDFNVSRGEQQKAPSFPFPPVSIKCVENATVPAQLLSCLPEGSCLLPAWHESHASLSCWAKEVKDLQGILALPAPRWLPLLELSLTIAGPRTERLGVVHRVYKILLD